MKALIFGIGGFVGRYLTSELQSHGYKVAGSDVMLGCDLDDVEYYNGDLLDATFVEKVVEKTRPDAIINLAAISSVGASWKIPQTTMQVNVVGALNILEAAGKCAREAKILFIGSSEEYCAKDSSINENDPISANNPYGISKVAQEQFVECYRQRFGLKIHYVRPFNHTGVGQKDSFVLPSFCKQAASLEAAGEPGEIRVGNLTAKRDFSDVRDIARAYRMILDQADLQLGQADDGGILLAGLLAEAAQHRLDAGQHLAGAEGLYDVIVRAQLQAQDAVDLLALGGEHDDRQAAGLADGAADVDARHAGHHQVQHHHVRMEALHHLQGLLAVVGALVLIALGAQVQPQRLVHHRIVVGDQNKWIH